MKETVLQVDGMSCPSCIRHIDSALCELSGVEKVDVKLRERTVAVRHDPTSAPLEVLVEALRDAGYEAQLHAASN